MFLIGGGRHPGQTCMNLLIDGKVVQTATGKNSERLNWEIFDVSKYIGKTAQMEIVDAHSGGWGHIMVDQIVFADEKALEGDEIDFGKQKDYGSMALALVDEGGGDVFARADGELPDSVFAEGEELLAKRWFEDGEKLRDLVTSQLQCVEAYLTPYTPVMAGHTGPVVAMSFYS